MLALLSVDVQAELVAHLADLRSTLSKVDPGRLAFQALFHISRQVIQELWEEAENTVNIASADDK